ncbi:PH and SEC7 domain-containing protein 1 [Antennarius striatus]|uniref:PH and SEC7 domain-containing protein 1 n=1 Tax=Antennarius striatus TaxID=241820 RepID=UPI0035ADD92B
MEEDNFFPSLTDITDSVPHLPQQDSWTSIGQQVETSHRSGDFNLPPQARRDSPEDVQQWGQIIWPVRHMTSTSPPISFATVQWDMPDPSAEPSPLMTGGNVANELSFGCVTRLGTNSPSAEEISAEVFTQEFREEDDGFDSQILDSNLERTGSGSEPRDAANVKEPTPQEEEEDSTHELSDSDNEIFSVIDSEEEQGHPVLLEGQEESDVLLTRERDSQRGQTSLNGLETEEEIEKGGEVEEELSLTNLSRRKESEEAQTSCLTAEEIPAPPTQTDNIGPTVNPDKLIVPQQHTGRKKDIQMLERLLQSATCQVEETGMCKETTPAVNPKQSDNHEPSVQASENAESGKEMQEMLELVKETEENSCLEHQYCDHMTSESEQLHVKEEREPIRAVEQTSVDQVEQPHHLDESPPVEPTGESNMPQSSPEESPPSGQTVCVGAEDPGVPEQEDQTEQNEQITNFPPPMASERDVRPETDESEITEQQVTDQSKKAAFNQTKEPPEMLLETREAGGGEGGSERTVVANGEHRNPPGTTAPLVNGHGVDREVARGLAQQLFNLEGIQRVDVVKHLDKDNDFSRAVGEEYLKFFDFTGQTLDHALRSFLKVVMLIGETQERERVLQHFACRFHQCNPDSYSSSDAAFALTCALMLLNTDLHGQNVGKTMSSSKFVSNLDGMNDGGNFNKDLLKSLYSSIKTEPLEWAVDEEELKSSMLMDEDGEDDTPLRSNANPFQDVSHDGKAPVVKEGFLQRKLHADVDGKRTPWGKRGWKTFYGVLRGMVLYLQKYDSRRDQQANEVVSVHHSLAEQASNYNKKPHVLSLQTANQRVFLFQASSKVEMISWINRINLVAALHSSPPFPAAVGSQRRFLRPTLPAVQSAHTMERQLQFQSGMLESFKKDLSYLKKNPPEGKKAKAKELEEHRLRAEYLQHEVCRYEAYIQVLDTWRSVKKMNDDLMNVTELKVFDDVMRADSAGEKTGEDGLKKCHSSPSLELLPQTVIKVRRNISERRTYRRPIIPRWNKDA